MNRHDLANEVLGYKESLFPSYTQESTMSVPWPTNALRRSISLRSKTDAPESVSGETPGSRPASIIGTDTPVQNTTQMLSPPKPEPESRSWTYDGTTRPALTIDPTKILPVSELDENVAPDAQPKPGNEGEVSSLSPPQDRIPGTLLTPTSPDTPGIQRNQNPATGAYRDLTRGGDVVETDQDGNPAEPTLHPQIASPRVSQADVSSPGVSAISMPGLNAAAEFLPQDGRSITVPQFMTPVMSQDPDALNLWNDTGPQVTGFAVASSKRNADFHALFPSLPDDDYLIESYACAVNRDLLIQGRLYVSEHHLCFHSNIFGWVTSLAVAFADVLSIEKRNTAYLIPNAISVHTLRDRYLFSSLVSRDVTYSMLVNIWRMSTPSETTQRVAQELSDASDEDVATDDGAHDTSAAAPATAGAVAADAPAAESEPAAQAAPEAKPDSSNDKSAKGPERMTKREKLRRHLSKARKNIKRTGKAEKADAADDESDSDDADDSDDLDSSMSDEDGDKGTSGADDHSPTTCDCEKNKEHLSNVVMDEILDATPRQVFDLLFVNDFMKTFWTDSQQLRDVEIGEWHSDKDGKEATATRSVTYVKPLSGPIGPKQTRCLITDEQLHIDFDDFCTAVTTTRTPDVPSGNNFSVRTRLCFTWAEQGRTRLYVTCGVDWTGRSMIKSVIDKASIEGQKEYFHSLGDAIRQYIIDHPEVYGSHKSSASKSTQENTKKSDQRQAQSKTESEAASSRLNDIWPNQSILILSVLIVVLLISNVWVYLRGAPGAMRDPNNPHRLLRPKAGQLTMRETKIVLQDEVQALLDTLANSRRVTEEIELQLLDLKEFIQQQTKREDIRRLEELEARSPAAA